MAACTTAIRRCSSALIRRAGQPRSARLSSYSSEGPSTEAFWGSVVERLQAAPSNLVTSRLAAAVQGGLAGEGHVEPPAQAVFDGVTSCYSGLQQEEKMSFFTALASHLGTDRELAAGDRASPLSAAVLSQLGRQKGGLRFLVDLRADLQALPQPSSLRALEEVLTNLLGQYCSRDLLEVEKVTWQSPSDLIEKISTAEVVHPVRHWKDIKNRLGHNMRCFVLTHKGIPREPLVVLHSALTSEPSASVQDLLHAASREDCSGRGFSTAVFYSVWLRERGLAGLDLPNLLIKMAAADLQAEFPYMGIFYTLSPVPGFRRWLEGQLRQKDGANRAVCGVPGVERVLEQFPTDGGQEGTVDSFKSALDALPAQCDDAQFVETLRRPLMHLCVHYLMIKRGRSVLDPVANFHLRNGASLHRVNWLADRSGRGMRRSYGLMVNYCYNMASLARNTRRYLQDGEVPYSPQHLDQWLT